ncbi:MAG: hypothetical protein RLY93_16895 [Sumerlaeia bacterium]
MKRRQKIKRSTAASKSWEMFAVATPTRESQKLPELLPVPPRELQRAQSGRVSYTEFAQWLRKYLRETPEAENREVLEKTAERLALLQESKEAAAGGDFQTAREKLLRAHELEPGDALAALDLASIEHNLNNNQRAEELLGGLQQRLTGEARFELVRSRVAGALGRGDEQRAILWSAYERNPKNGTLLNELQSLGEVIATKFNTEKPDQIRFTKRAEYDQAVKKAFADLEAKKDWKALGAQVKFHLEDGRADLAMDAARILYKHKDVFPRAAHFRGLALVELKNLPEALQVLEPYCAANPADTAAKVALARAQGASGNAEAARATLRETLEQDPENLTAAELLILQYQSDEERWQMAEELAQKYPAAWVPHKTKGDLHFAKEQFNEALECHLKAWSKGHADDALTMALHEMGRLGKIGEAVKLIKTVTDLDNRGAKVRWNSANLLIEARRYEPAKQILRRMVADKRLPHGARLAANNLLREF